MRVNSRLFLQISDQPMITIPIPPKGPKVTSLIWGTLDEKLITGHENGDIVQWDVKEHQKVSITSDHMKSISDMQLSPDRKYFLYFCCTVHRGKRYVVRVGKNP